MPSSRWSARPRPGSADPGCRRQPGFAAGIGTKPPMLVDVGAGGSDAEARRVEINKQW
jgi:hypothetical protein